MHAPIAASAGERPRPGDRPGRNDALDDALNVIGAPAAACPGARSPHLAAPAGS